MGVTGLLKSVWQQLGRKLRLEKWNITSILKKWIMISMQQPLQVQRYWIWWQKRQNFQTLDRKKLNIKVNN